MDASIVIWSGTKFNVDVTLYSVYSNEFSGINLSAFNTFQQRSYAVICTHNLLHRKQSHRIIEYGKRQSHDFLIHFMKTIAKAEHRTFPSHTFDFTDPEVNISYVKLMIDVSRYLIW